jgi:hypothetical protein
MWGEEGRVRTRRGETEGRRKGGVREKGSRTVFPRILAS